MSSVDPLETSSVEARHLEVLGQPPRIPPLKREEVAEEVQATTKRLIAGIAGPSAPSPSLPVEAIPEIMFTLCRYPELWQSIIDVTIQLQGPNSTLPPRDRKLAILRTGWLCQAPYEFGEHVSQAKRLGFTAEEIDQIREGPAALGWSAHDKAVLQAVDELHKNAMVSDATWEQLATTLNHHQLFELLVLIGQFTATAYFQNGLRLRLEPGNGGLST